MPGTAACHHDIAAAVRPQTDPVCDPAPALDPPVARRDPPPASAPGPVVASAASAWRLGGVGTPTRPAPVPTAAPQARATAGPRPPDVSRRQRRGRGAWTRRTVGTGWAFVFPLSQAVGGAGPGGRTPPPAACPPGPRQPLRRRAAAPEPGGSGWGPRRGPAGRRAAGVGRGPGGSTGNRRAVRGFPSIRHAALRAWPAAAHGGTSGGNASRVTRVPSRNAIGRDGHAVNRQPALGRASCHGLVMAEAPQTRKKAG